MEKLDKIKCVLSIAGSDSGAGAGIQADMKSVAACGGYCTTAITAITAQNSVSVNAISIVSDDMIAAQIDSVMQDFNVTAIKLGMLPSIGCVDVVRDAILKYNIKSVVLDPVMVATSGDMLVGEDVARYIIKLLFPLATVVTPNIPECEFITSSTIKSLDDFENLVPAFKKLGCNSVLFKAGHLESEVLTDYLYTFDNNQRYEHSFNKIDTPNTHGTGCSLSSSIAAFLSQGFELSESVKRAEEYLHLAISESKYVMGDGHGAINHLFMLKK